jgi:hypothetical protein
VWTEAIPAISGSPQRGNRHQGKLAATAQTPSAQEQTANRNKGLQKPQTPAKV